VVERTTKTRTTDGEGDQEKPGWENSCMLINEPEKIRSLSEKVDHNAGDNHRPPNEPRDQPNGHFPGNDGTESTLCLYIIVVLIPRGFLANP